MVMVLGLVVFAFADATAVTSDGVSTAVYVVAPATAVNDRAPVAAAANTATDIATRDLHLLPIIDTPGGKWIKAIAAGVRGQNVAWPWAPQRVAGRRSINWTARRARASRLGHATVNGSRHPQVRTPSHHGLSHVSFT